MSNFLKVLRDLALLIARVSLGAVLILHAWHRWQNEGIEAQTAYLTSFGFPWPQYAAWGAIIGETAAGILLIIGFLTPLAAAGVLVEQVLIICWISWRTFPFGGDRGWADQLVLGVLALLFVVYGAGRASIDSVFRRPSKNGADVDDAMAP